MNSIACVIFGYIIGIVASWFIFNPMKAFEEGIEQAKIIFTDWDRGFYAGWDACKKHFEEGEEE